jgi:hypothetical protein
MNAWKEHVKQIFDEVLRALKDKADSVRDTLDDAAQRLFPAPRPARVENAPPRPRQKTPQSHRHR